MKVKKLTLVISSFGFFENIVNVRVHRCINFLDGLAQFAYGRTGNGEIFAYFEEWQQLVKILWEFQHVKS